MKIAIPVWEDKISPVMDTASRLLIVETKDKCEQISRFVILLDEQDYNRKCLRIQNLNIDILICGAISRSFLQMLTALDIDIFSEISGRTEEVLEAFFQGNLVCPKFLMPGCQRKRYRLGNISVSNKRMRSCKR